MTAILRLLGGASLHRDGEVVRGPASHRHPLALLALLARAPDGSMRRERLIGLLWPEQSTARARHRLRQAVHLVRKELGAEVLLTVGDELRLDPVALDVDARAFDDAVEEGRAKRAVELYEGAFLEGFHLSGAVEFERWVERERGELAARLVRTLRSAGARARERGDLAEAVEWYRGLAARRPADSRFALLLMETLAAHGSPAEAILHAEKHSSYLSDELELEPDPAVRRLVRRLRAGAELELPFGEKPEEPGTLDLPGSREQAVASGLTTGRRPSTASAFVAASTFAAAALSGPGSPRSKSRNDGVRGNGVRLRRAVMTVLPAALVALALAWWARPRGAAAQGKTIERVAVLPFRIEDPSRAAEGQRIPELLSERLALPGRLDVRPLPPGSAVPGPSSRSAAGAAVEAGVGRYAFYVAGRLTGAPDARLHVSLMAPDGAELAESDAAAADDASLESGLDRVALDLLHAYWAAERP